MEAAIALMLVIDRVAKEERREQAEREKIMLFKNKHSRFAKRDSNL